MSRVITIDRWDYADKLRAMWLGECIANWTGLRSEGDKKKAPFFTDDDWSSFGYVLRQDPWGADDDTDIEYVYLHLLNRYALTTLTPAQIRDGWMQHINDWIWVSNAKVRRLMDLGLMPPATALFDANELAIYIDAQLTTEIFGALAPGMPDKALHMADLPIRTSANGHAAHAAQFHVILYSLACLVDPHLSGRDQALWLVDQARSFFPGTSKVADIIDFVRSDYLQNPDVDDWESTRDKIYERYQLHDSQNGFRYVGWTESSVNLAVSLMILLYGGMDYRRTVQIGTLAGWDSDNPTATMGGLVGLVSGYERLAAAFPEVESLSDRYYISRTRDKMPDYLPDDKRAQDTFQLMAGRMLDIIDLSVVEAGGSVGVEGWILPQEKEPALELNPLYELMQRSANNRVRESGGAITIVSSSGESGVEAIADGFEHDFSGREWFGDVAVYTSKNADSTTLTVTYDRPVEIHTIRLIEGGGPNGFTDAVALVFFENRWIEPPGGSTPSVTFDTAQGYQIIDYILEDPVVAEGIRIAGPVKGHVNILELDALSSPWHASGNRVPAITITAPSPGIVYEEPADIEILAEASDPDGQLQRVEFYQDSQKLGEDTTPPYEFLWTDVPAGSYKLLARAIDDAGAVRTSPPVWIFVEAIESNDVHIWHSYDVVMASSHPQATLMDNTESVEAEMLFYRSENVGGVDEGLLFEEFSLEPHREEFNHVGEFWSNSTGMNAYPYVGRSTVGRGGDNGESNMPAPAGVLDLQLHPPNSDHLVVAAFVVPLAGNYFVSDLAVRRVAQNSGTATYKIFNAERELVTELKSDENRSWVMDGGTYVMENLQVGDRICFAVDRDGDFGWDATEIAWTLTREKDIDTGTAPGQSGSAPERSALQQNFPNPFNSSTNLSFHLPAGSYVLLRIFDVRGQFIRTLIQDHLPAGYHSILWDGREKSGEPVSSGVYFARLETATQAAVVKMIYIK